MQVTGLKNLIFIAKHSAGKNGSKFISFPCFLKACSKGKRRGKKLKIIRGNYSILLSCCYVLYFNKPAQNLEVAQKWMM